LTAAEYHKIKFGGVTGDKGPAGGTLLFTSLLSSPVEVAPAYTEFKACYEDHVDVRVRKLKVLWKYDDWRLPTGDELNAMYSELKQKGIGGFRNAVYFSPDYDKAIQKARSQQVSYFFWKQDFENGIQSSVEMIPGTGGHFDWLTKYWVRAVRDVAP